MGKGVFVFRKKANNDESEPQPSKRTPNNKQTMPPVRMMEGTSQSGKKKPAGTQGGGSGRTAKAKQPVQGRPKGGSAI